MRKELFLKKLGAHIVQLRKKAGLSQTELALRCGKDKQSLHRIEKGQVNPTALSLKEIAKELEIPLKDIFDFE